MAYETGVATSAEDLIGKLFTFLTDGGIYLGATPGGEPVELKRYQITDGLGIHMLQRSGIEVAIVTGRDSESVALRAAELGIREVHQGVGRRKLATVAADRRVLISKSIVPFQVITSKPDLTPASRRWWHPTRSCL